jgi:hypothetical protein
VELTRLIHRKNMLSVYQSQRVNGLGAASYRAPPTKNHYPQWVCWRHLQSKMKPRVSYPAATLCLLPLTAGLLSNNWLLSEEWRGGGGGFTVLKAVRDLDTTDLGRFNRRPTTVISDMYRTAVWDAATCSSVEAYEHFEGKYWFHHQDGK